MGYARSLINLLSSKTTIPVVPVPYGSIPIFYQAYTSSSLLLLTAGTTFDMSSSLGSKKKVEVLV
ncbi:MAG: hypothetical protein OHM57_09925 [Spiroplasma phoeniceum]|nr:MAG: hypothetical protein OHM57_09925 [Spiroplasma phoeniceum]